MDLNEWGKILTVGGSICGGVWWVWTKLLKPYLAKVRVRKANERRMLYEIHAEMQMDGNGSIKTAIVTMNGRLERIEDKVDNIEENQKLSLNLQGISFWVSDANGEYTYVSPALCKLLGRSESEILGSNWTSSIIYEDREKTIKAWEFSVENQTGFDEIYTVRRPDGMYFKVWAVALPKAGKKVFGGTMGKLTAIEEPHREKIKAQ